MIGAASFYCEERPGGICILECRSLDSMVRVPEEIRGLPVVELAPYLFSMHKNYNDVPHPTAFWWSGDEDEVCGAGGQTAIASQTAVGQTAADQSAAGQAGADAPCTPDLPLLKGDALKELHLPSTLRKVGAYALYNCEKLQKMELYTTTLDWGAGVFTGCAGVKELTVHVDESRKSCLKEVLAELRQTLLVEYEGVQTARLIFPEFFEEAVENTPARILVTETHGCGQKYRNCFIPSGFHFQEYDSLFPHVQVQEPERLVVELALGRLMYPCQLTETHKKTYMDYLEHHRTSAACQAVEQEDMNKLQWLTEHLKFEGQELNTVTEAANRVGNMTAVSFLMEKTRNQGNVKRKRFSL